MPIIAIPKKEKKHIFKDRKSALRTLSATGELGKYDLFYIYPEQRWKYSPSYPALHRKAALKSYHKNKKTTRPRGRPRKVKDEK